MRKRDACPGLHAANGRALAALLSPVLGCWDAWQVRTSFSHLGCAEPLVPDSSFCSQTELSTSPFFSSPCSVIGGFVTAGGLLSTPVLCIARSHSPGLDSFHSQVYQYPNSLKFLPESSGVKCGQQGPALQACREG